MTRDLRISDQPIDEPSLIAQRTALRETGAVIYFSGVVRGSEAQSPIRGIRYEAFLAMAEHQFHKLFDEIERRWPIQSVRLVHRIGPVLVGEASLWLEVLAPHRAEAFAACEFLIDEMKRVVPIWKHPMPPLEAPHE
jgi:molybdopterin synthase catalytic subunit